MKNISPKTTSTIPAIANYALIAQLLIWSIVSIVSILNGNAEGAITMMLALVLINIIPLILTEYNFFTILALRVQVVFWIIMMLFLYFAKQFADSPKWFLAFPFFFMGFNLFALHEIKEKRWKK